MKLKKAISRARKQGHKLRYCPDENIYICTGNRFSFGFSPDIGNQPDSEVFPFFVRNHKKKRDVTLNSYKKMMKYYGKVEHTSPKNK